MITYEQIKQRAQDQKCQVKDLVALSPKNDPFYVGTPGDLADATWFRNLWESFGYTKGVHIRRMHYQLVSQDPPVSKPNGEPYENTMNDWSFLNTASKAARYLGFVDPANFVDRRNPDPIIHATYWGDNTPGYHVNTGWGAFDINLPTFPDMPTFSVSGYNEGTLQPYHLEIWVEKSTMNDVLDSLCRRYDVNLVTGAGEMSITAVLQLVNRVKEADRPCRIFYISDFDPAGYGMPISVARKIEFLAQGEGLDIRLEPVALTSDQVTKYNLPRTPIKPTEMRRGAFEEVHGSGAVELDALEALYPGALAEIIEVYLREYYDDEIAEEARHARNDLRDRLDQERAEALADLDSEEEELRCALQSAVDDFEKAIGPIKERLPQLFEMAVERLNSIDVDLDEHALPKARIADEEDDVLFDSSRGYNAQLRYYKLQRAGKRNGGE